MSLFVHHVNHVQDFPGGILEQTKQKIELKSLSSVKVSLGTDKDYQYARALNDIYNQDSFLQIYNNIITEIINENFGSSFSDSVAKNPDLFSPNSDIIKLTTAFNKITTAGGMLKRFDALIAELRGVFKYLLPDKQLSTNGKEFFEDLGAAFKNSKIDSLVELVENCKTLGEQYEQLVGLNARAGLPEKWIGTSNGALFKLIGTGVWERIAMDARAKALKLYFKDIENPLVKAFYTSGATSVRISTRQAGSEKIQTEKGMQSQLVDSILTIEILDNNGTVLVRVETGDSTKFSQSWATRNTVNSSYGTKNSWEYTLGAKLSEINGKLRNYWEQRMGAFLTERNTRAYATSNDIVSNWNITLEALKLLCAYDTMAVRVGGGVQTLSFNEKIRTMNVLANAAVMNNFVKVSKISEIVNPAGGYRSYVTSQIKKEPVNETTEIHLEDYNTYINALMNTKFTVTVNLSNLMRN